MTEFDYGPIDFYLIGFDGDHPGPEVLEAIDDLVAEGIVNLLDLVFVARDRAGSLSVMEVSNSADADGVSALTLPGLASDDDIDALAAAVPPGASAAVLVVELLWAKRFAARLFDAGGFVAARQGVPAPLVNAYLDVHAA
ncbi:DUF6325 family protein [Microbacterium sp.]|uniref:DUF6325 family protein n=1 Tax=Microbacterium sp. TaxID=51671 RepID=UPI0037CB8D41